MKKKWVVGTRGSKLALRQAQIVIDALRSAHPEHEFSIKIINTKGDTIWDKPLHLIGGKGLFVGEIETELAGGEIDMAVHSMKDLPADLAEGLSIGAVPAREDARDAFISPNGRGLGELSEGCRVGTGSLRRKAQLLRYRGDIEVVPLRGNVETRIKKIERDRLDGIILAASGVKRMGLESVISEIIPFDIMVPSPGQGAIAVEVRRGDSAEGILVAINHERSYREIAIERAVQAGVGGGCHVPLGVHARIEDGNVDLYLSFGNEENGILIQEKILGSLAAQDKLIADALKILLGNPSKK